jgi:hypothetical protein
MLAFGKGLVAFQFKTKVQIKDLTHILFLNPFHMVYKQHVLF